MVTFGSALSTAALLVTLVACSDTTGDDTSNAPACTGAVTISVSAGTTPTFNWTPVCKVFFLNVEATGGADQWGIITNSTNGIAPPVAYGTVPPGAQLNTPGTAALVPATPYTVYLFRWTGPGAQDGLPVGNQAFTP